MIFYFTGTGNSYAAALQLQLRLGGELLNVTDCMQRERFHFALKADEPVGIICPVYYCGLPSIVEDFLDRISFDPAPSYLFGVLTCGVQSIGAKGRLAQKIRDRGYEMSGVWKVRMPANYAILYEPTHEEAAEQILETAGGQLEKIITKIKNHEVAKADQGVIGKIVFHIVHPMYDRARKTKPFYTNEQCVSCGVCAGRCPVNAIEMIDGTPTWVKEKCVFCMSCVRCNAIQYGSKLQDRFRYRHPVFQKKKKAPDCH